MTIGLDHVDHMAVAVWSIPDALALYRDTLGGTFVNGGDNAALGIRTLQLQLPGLKVELISPLRDTSYLHGFLSRRGEGVHHVTMIVADVVVAADRLLAAGYETVDLDLSDPEWRETYLRPRHGFGVLIQLADTTKDWSRPDAGYGLEDVLAGRVTW
jgi:methylmalonyl-CoA/ethylmalonyl-CoA epimerase